jgi:hypothetical protein
MDSHDMMPADPQEARRFHDVRAALARLSAAEAAPALREMAQRVRHDDLHMVYRAGLGHLGGDFSVADILVTLYAGVTDGNDVTIIATGQWSPVRCKPLRRWGRRGSVHASSMSYSWSRWTPRPS